MPNVSRRFPAKPDGARRFDAFWRRLGCPQGRKAVADPALPPILALPPCRSPARASTASMKTSPSRSASVRTGRKPPLASSSCKAPEAANDGSLGRAPEQRAPRPPGGTAPIDDHASAGSQNAEQLANETARDRRAGSRRRVRRCRRRRPRRTRRPRPAARSSARLPLRRARRPGPRPFARARPMLRRGRRRRRVRTSPTLAATAPRRPPCAQPICTKRSPIFVPTMPTTSRWGLPLFAKGFNMAIGRSVYLTGRLATQRLPTGDCRLVTDIVPPRAYTC